MAKDTSWAKVTSNSEKIKPVALAIVELRESEGIRQTVSWSVENLVLKNKFKKNHSNFFKRVSGRSESLFGLSFT